MLVNPPENKYYDTTTTCPTDLSTSLWQHVSLIKDTIMKNRFIDHKQIQVVLSIITWVWGAINGQQMNMLHVN